MIFLYLFMSFVLGGLFSKYGLPLIMIYTLVKMLSHYDLQIVQAHGDIAKIDAIKKHADVLEADLLYWRNWLR